MRIIIILIMLFSFLSAETYYISTTGSDANNGTTEGTAWASWDYAMNKFANDNTNPRVLPGDSLLFVAGTYDFSTMWVSPTSGKSYPYLYANTTAVSAVTYIGCADGDGHSVVLDGGGSNPVIGCNTDFHNFHFDSLIVRNGSPCGFSFGTGYGDPFAHSPKFTRMLFYNNTDANVNNNPGGLWLAASEYIIEYCTFRNNGTPGSSHHNSANLVLWGDYGSYSETDPRFNGEISYCVFDSSATGIKQKGDCNYVNSSDSSDNQSTYGSRYHHNVFSAITGDAIYSDADYDTIDHNLFINCSKGIYIHSPDNASTGLWFNQIFNNTFYNCSDVSIDINSSQFTTDGMYHSVFNNLIIDPGVAYAIDFFGGQATTWTMAADHNGVDNAFATMARRANSGNLNLAGWQALGFGTGSLLEALTLTDPANDDYTATGNALNASRSGTEDLGAMDTDWYANAGYGGAPSAVEPTATTYTTNVDSVWSNH